MDTSEFSKPAGEFVDINGSDGLMYKAFVPAKLPVKIDFDNEALVLLEKAGQSLGRLDGIGKYLVKMLNVDMAYFIRPYLRNEAVMSSRIEGTRSTLLDVLDAEMKGDTAQEESKGDLFEVLNYVRAQNYGMQYITHSNDIGLELIKELHKRLLMHVRGEKAQPGSFREVQNYISKYQTGRGIEYATYIPPPPGMVPQLLENLVEYMESGQDPPLVKIALMHYQFEAIHPFLDGNGRIGRLLIMLYAAKEKVLTEPLLYMSEYFEANRLDYYSLLLNVSKNSAYLEWIKFFLTGIVSQSEKTIRGMESMVEYYDNKRGIINSKYSKSTLAVFQFLFSHPMITLPMAAKMLNLKYPTVKKAAMNLIEEGVLEKMEWKKRPTRFIAKTLYEIHMGNYTKAQSGP
ncbi:MAG: Fic family protein [Candidatus Micrarchaeaceae archaeon]